MMEVPNDWVSVAEVAQWMAVHKNTVFRWIASGDLPAFKHGQTVRIREKALLEFILEHSTV